MKINSTVFVLPCVSSPTDDFLVDIDKATYFLVMPPWVECKDIGWDMWSIAKLCMPVSHDSSDDDVSLFEDETSDDDDSSFRDETLDEETNYNDSKYVVER